MHCLRCSGTTTGGTELYCSRACQRTAWSVRPPRPALPEQHRSTLRALLEDRPVSRAEAAGFFDWITRPRAA